MGIIIGTDFVPTDTNEDLFEAGNITRLFGNELAQILKESDYRIFNLEIPLTEELLKLIDRIECEAWRELTLEVLRIEVFGDK